MPDNKYYIPANYYYGFISYYDKQYNEALKAFKLVETHDDYKGVVPYYIAEIYYFQGKKDEALRYGESVLSRGGTLFYQKEMNLLIGQLYFEKKNYKSIASFLCLQSNFESKAIVVFKMTCKHTNYKFGQYIQSVLKISTFFKWHYK